MKQCNYKGCTNGAVKGGVCKTHGAKVEKKHRSFEGCTSQAQKGEFVLCMAQQRIDAALRGVKVSS